MNKDFLMDEYLEKGDSLLELKHLLKELDLVTRAEIVRKKDLTIYSLMKTRKCVKRAKTPGGKIKVVSENEEPVNEIEQILKDGNIYIHTLKPRNVWNYTETGVPYLSTTKIQILPYIHKVVNKEAFLNEVLSNGMIWGYGKDLFFVSEKQLQTFGMRVDMSGSSLLDATLERNVHMAQLLNKDEEMTLIIRTVEGVDKVYAALSKKYSYIPQSILMTIVEKFDPKGTLGKMKCREWSVSHGMTRIELEFPEKAKELQAAYGLKDTLIPGIILEKSDIGECSITIKGSWRYGAYPVVESEIKRKHTGTIDIEKIVIEAQEEIFEKYTLLPERLCELMSIDITDPSWRTLKKRKFKEVNKEAVSMTIKSIFKQIDLTKQIAKKNEKMLFEALCDEIDPDMNYTAYDVCLMIMNAPGRVHGLSEVYLNNFEKAVGKAPYATYSMKKSTKPIVLTA